MLTQSILSQSSQCSVTSEAFEKPSVGSVSLSRQTTRERLNSRQDKQFLCIDFMNREEIVSRLIFLPMLLSSNYGSLKIAQIKLGKKQEKPFFSPSSQTKMIYIAA